MSHQIREIFAEYTPLIEPLSLDEAYLDVTENLKEHRLGDGDCRTDPGENPPRDRAYRVRWRLVQQIPGQDGFQSAQARRAVRHYANDGRGLRRNPAGRQVSRDWSRDEPPRWSGSASVVGSDLKAQTLAFLQQQFGKAGPYYYWIARGIDERPVCADRVRKSIGAENTFIADLFTVEEARAALEPIVEKVWRHCEETTIRGRTVTLKAKYADFQQITRSRTVRAPFTTQAAIEEIVVCAARVALSRQARAFGCSE